ncbi:ABC transporter permease [Mucilaginibacter sp. UR6-11]|uniref:ABC transporter permease n=1 Tax=Mucilaginibacter sp. UR6-11 TaxID=1435644 RepID=UPI001E40CD32|nr:ABC transporter permease [Mucilaginibacter sp. UR6-11]MCC8425874.1 ABC transporter permease [Mucilaginibacter sp. UR6-11]
MFKLWISIKKDIRILLRDKVGISLMFVMPIILVIVVTSIQNSTFQLVNKNKLPIIICNTDTGKAGAQFIESVNKIGMFNVSQIPGEKATTIADAMHDKDALLGIVIPTNFSSQVNNKAKAASDKAMAAFSGQTDSVKAVTKQAANIDPLTLYYNPVLQESLRFSIQGAIRSALQLVQTRETLRTLYYASNEKELPKSLENEMLNSNTTINMLPVSKDGTRTTPNASQHNVPAWTIFAMFFVIMSLGGSVVREKVSGSFIRLKTLPTNYLVGLLSKQMTYLAVTLIQAVVIFSIGIWLFPVIGLPALNLPADLFGLFVVTLVCGWCAVSYAICVGVFANTQEQANGFGAISIVILACIGGLMVPSFAMQGMAKTLTNISPMHWCLQAYYSLFLEGAKLKDVLNNIGSLFIITIIIQFITYLGLKRKNLI